MCNNSASRDAAAHIWEINKKYIHDVISAVMAPGLACLVKGLSMINKVSYLAAFKTDFLAAVIDHRAR